MKKRNPQLEASSQALAGSTSALNKPDLKPGGKSNSARSTGLCLVTDFPELNNLKMSATKGRQRLERWIASSPGSHARTSATPVHGRGDLDSGAHAAVCSTRSYVISTNYNPNGWCLRTSLHCSIQTIAATLQRSSKSLPSAGIWDASGCLMLRISEAPRNVVACSWSGVLEAQPRLSYYLTPRQWTQYLHRLARSDSHKGRWHGQGILYRRAMQPAESVLGVSFLLLKRTDGIRWLSGKERLRVMGFPSDWMSEIGRRFTPQETRSLCSAQSSSRKKSSRK